MRWWRVLATADEEPDRAVILRQFKQLLRKKADVLPYVLRPVDRVERFKERIRRQA